LALGTGYPLPTLCPPSPHPALRSPQGPDTKASLVGSRVAVLWPNSNFWFRGRIDAVNASNGKCQIKYDDGQVREALSTLGAGERGQAPGERGGEGCFDCSPSEDGGCCSSSDQPFPA
jgi:hypothetical protein